MLDIVNLPPWAQTTLTVLGLILVALPQVAPIVERYSPAAAKVMREGGSDLLAFLRLLFPSRMPAPPADKADK